MKLLEELIPEENQALAKVRYIEGHGKALFDTCRDQELEGIVLKRADSIYKVGKRPEGIWYKVVNYNLSKL